MKVYTKTGDKGKTGLIGGQRVGKEDFRLESYGTVDELNAFIGMGIAQCREAGIVEPLQTLEAIQNSLFVIGSILATPDEKKDKFAPAFSPDITEILEKQIDRMTKKLPPLKNFILPGGSPAAAGMHLARTVCRRLERRIAKLYLADQPNWEVIKFVNRLSDYLFTLARYINFKLKIAETIWMEKADPSFDAGDGKIQDPSSSKN